MKWKNRLTNYNFWVSIVSAVLLIFQAFDINFDLEYVNEIVTAVLGVLVVVGIISDPTKSSSETSSVSNVVATETETSEESSTGSSEVSVTAAEGVLNAVAEEETVSGKGVAEVISATPASDVCSTSVALAESQNETFALETQISASSSSGVDHENVSNLNETHADENLQTNIPIDEENAVTDNAYSADNEISVTADNQSTETEIKTNSFNIVN